MKVNEMDLSSENGFERYLLCGINLIDNPQMDTSGVKRVPILDEKKLNKNPQWKNVDAGDNRFIYQTFVENSQYDLVKSIQLGAGISGSYEGIGLGYNFTTALSKSFSQNTRYGDVKSTCKIQQYQNILTNGVLCNFVTDEFRANTHVMTAQKLFETYGTHLILKFSVGGRLDIEFVTKSHTTKENAQIRQEAQASYLVLTGKNSTEYKEQFAYFNQDCVYKII